jgi:HEPN domain-containing protein
MADDEAPDVRALEVRGWLLRASEDLRAGRHDLTAIPPLLNDVAFHAQQCAEKSMKALLVHHERPSRKTHNLTELGHAVVTLEPSLTELMKRASLMTEFAWRFRYPGEQASASWDDATDAIDTAAAVLDAIMNVLPTICRPDGSS